jgi:C1A family cysteine protease
MITLSSLAIPAYATSSSIQNGNTSALSTHGYSLGAMQDANSTAEALGLGWLPEDVPADARVTPVYAAALPTHFDWRSNSGSNWMTPVKNQGGCGSCVAFGAVGAAEAQFKIQAGNPGWSLDLSEQHLFSCGGGSCSKGWYISAALNYLKNYGTPDESCSPYQAQSGGASCSNSCPDWQSRAFKIASWSWAANNPSALQAALMNGPLVAGFNVYTDFFSYHGGVYHYDGHSSLAGGHAIVIVGYDSNEQYWIVKNSWGASWGEGGYFRIGFGEAGIENYVASITAGAMPTTPYAASVVSNDIPTTMSTGQTYTVHVTVKNDGGNTWTAADSYKLGFEGDNAPFGPNRVLIDPGVTVATGQQYTFTFTLTPRSAGSFTLRYRMVRELVTWFGTNLAVTVTVNAAAQSVNNAAITGNDIPTIVTAGQTYTVHVTVQNTGSTTWTASSGYKLGAVGDSDPFAPTRILLDSGDYIGSGQSKTFTFTMTAPSKPGSYVTDWRMVREGVAWFGTTLAVAVSVSGAVQSVDNAAITTNDIPTGMVAGQTYTVHVTVQNTGTTIWTASAGYKLGAVGDSDPFAPNRILLDSGDSIAPGQSKAFTFTMTAPSKAGSYVTDWRMVREGVAWFGSTLLVQLTVQAGPEQYGAAIAANDMPTSMTAGESYVVHVTVQNTGLNTWTAADGYKLGAAGDVDPFGPTRILLDASDSIAKGQSKAFTFTVTAPRAPGTYVVTWRMVREGVTWFGASSKVSVSVSSGVKNAVIVGSDMPGTMTAGQTYTIHITVQNTGTTTWAASGNYKLGFVGDRPPFGPARVLLDPSASVAPGQQYTFTFTITASSTTGTYTMQYRMVQELVTWFGQSTTTTVRIQ